MRTELSHTSLVVNEVVQWLHSFFLSRLAYCFSFLSLPTLSIHDQNTTLLSKCWKQWCSTLGNPNPNRKRLIQKERPWATLQVGLFLGRNRSSMMVLAASSRCARLPALGCRESSRELCASMDPGPLAQGSSARAGQ